MKPCNLFKSSTTHSVRKGVLPQEHKEASLVPHVHVISVSLCSQGWSCVLRPLQCQAKYCSMLFCTAPGTVKVEAQVSFKWNSKRSPELQSSLAHQLVLYSVSILQAFPVVGVFFLLRLTKCRNVLLPYAVLGSPVCGQLSKRFRGCCCTRASPVLLCREHVGCCSHAGGACICPLTSAPQ